MLLLGTQESDKTNVAYLLDIAVSLSKNLANCGAV
jgi:hypothetical protein